jgi:hypothetical protein
MGLTALFTYLRLRPFGVQSYDQLLARVSKQQLHSRR